MILHIPHSSVRFPEGTPKKDFSWKEISKMTDWYTDELFYHPYATQLIFPYSRLYCDVERFTEDEMDEVGMGICYTKTSDRKKLRDVSQKERAYIIRNYYEPHHRQLTSMVGQELKREGYSIIIDGHSFPKNPLPYEKDTNRPDVCLGTNENTPEWLVDIATRTLDYCGYSVDVNSPFSGSIVPLKYIGDKRVSSIMIEVNRGLYLEGNRKTEGFYKLKNDIHKLLFWIMEEGSHKHVE